ncbi:MBL fold metallo-hydrolase [Halocatena marina]|nr:MBL fold metallo-hydrolase [Halocatena marina]
MKRETTEQGEDERARTTKTDSQADSQGDSGSIPEIARGPSIPAKGYLVNEIRGGLYYVTDGTFQMLFLDTNDGVIVIDAPPTIGRDITKAIAEVTDDPITHVIYSHSHADHIGAASLYPETAEYVANERTAELLSRVDDPTRPAPTTTFEKNHTVAVGEHVLELAHKGTNHSSDNTFVFAPVQETLMFVDVVYPGWVPFHRLGYVTDIFGFIEAHDQILEYEFETFVGGHLTRLGTREDVKTQREYINDLKDASKNAIEMVELDPIAKRVGTDNSYTFFLAFEKSLVETAADTVREKWTGRLGGVDSFVESHCSVMIASLRVEYGILGPFGLKGNWKE